MQIKLTPTGPSMWFLGEPQNLIANLNFINPGPIEIDFDSLGQGYQQKLLTAIKSGHIESDIPFQELYSQWADERVVAAPPPKVAQSVAPKTEASTVKEDLKFEAKIQKRENEINTQINYLLKQPVRGIKVRVNQSKDIPFIRKFLTAEINGKHRKTLVKFLNERIKFLTIQAHKEIDKKINKNKNNSAKDPYRPKETIEYNVIDSEQKTVILTPDDLIMAVAENL